MGFKKKEKKMKLFAAMGIFAVRAHGATEYEVWDEYDNVCINYVGDTSCDRTDVAEKGPRQCAGVKIPTVKRGKFVCKALKKNKAKMQIRLRRGMERQVDQTGQSIQKSKRW